MHRSMSQSPPQDVPSKMKSLSIPYHFRVTRTIGKGTPTHLLQKLWLPLNPKVEKAFFIRKSPRLCSSQPLCSVGLAVTTELAIDLLHPPCTQQNCPQQPDLPGPSKPGSSLCAPFLIKQWNKCSATKFYQRFLAQGIPLRDPGRSHHSAWHFKIQLHHTLPHVLGALPLLSVYVPCPDFYFRFHYIYIIVQRKKIV